MSEKTYRLKITNHDDNWSCDGFVGQSVFDKINKNEFVEFNLLVKYLENDDALYERYHFSPVKNMTVDIKESTSEEVIKKCSN